MSSPLKEIRLLTSPLAVKKDAPRFVGMKEGKFSMSEARRALKHKEEYSYFYRIPNWTLEIDGWCYELVPLPLAKFKAITVGADPCEIKVSKSKEWQEIRDKEKIKPVGKKVGLTRKTHKEIGAEGHRIWKCFNNQKYLWLAQKGQNFAKQLIESIAVPVDDPGVSAAEKEKWESIPEPISGALNTNSITKGSALSISVTRAYVTAMYPAAGALEMGAAGGGVSGAVGTGSTAATGTSQGTAAGAGKAGLFGTKGAVTGSASTGKVGVGAKFAGLGHGAAGGKAAVLAKAGTAVAVAHPVGAGIAVVGASAIAARKLYKARQKKKNGQFAEPVEDDMGEWTVFELLRVEEQALDERESSAEEMNEIDEELLEDLDKMTLIATESAVATDSVVAAEPAIITEPIVVVEPAQRDGDL